MFYDGLTWLFDVSLLVLLLTPELLPLAACFDLLGLLSLGTGIFHVDDSFKKLNHTSLNIHFLLFTLFSLFTSSYPFIHPLFHQLALVTTDTD